MKRPLLLLTLMLIFSYSGIAQEYHKEDDILLADWLNNLARYSPLPCDKIKKIEVDTLMAILAKGPNNNLWFKKIQCDGHYHPIDSASLSFIRKERINSDLLREK